MGNSTLDVPLTNNASLRSQWRKANFKTTGIGGPQIKKPGYMSFESWKKSKGLNSGGKIKYSNYYSGGKVFTGR